jgi:hypothetical protein
MSKDEALKLALEALEKSIAITMADIDLRSKAITALRTAIEAAAQPAPVQEPVLKPLSKKWKWVLHESFADVAGFDEEGIPSFYWKESVTKFKSGELSAPCKGKNCGSLNGWLHSSECRAEHEAQYTTPPAQPAVQEPVACECNQGQVCHVCDPITPSKQSAQQEPAFWYYTLVVEGQVVGEKFTTVNWDTRVEPFGRYDIDHGGKVTKQPLYTTPPTAQRQCNWPTCQSEEYQQSLAEQINQELVTGAAQPAVQEPVAYEYGNDVFWHDSPDINDYIRANGNALVYATPPAAQPAVPDAMTSASAP